MTAVLNTLMPRRTTMIRSLERDLSYPGRGRGRRIMAKPLPRRVRLAGVSCRRCSKWRDGHGQEAIQARREEVGRAKQWAQGPRGLYGTRGAAEGSDQRLGGRS